ncbi:MAG TPA: hypothetical protein GXX29_05850 [Firmicutes bacterium]|nr:hypothetical protein [Bacillota bacterium]
MKKLALALCLVLTCSFLAYAETEVKVGVAGETTWTPGAIVKTDGQGLVLKVNSKGEGWTATYDSMTQRYKIRAGEGPLRVDLWGADNGNKIPERLSYLRSDSNLNYIQGSQDSADNNWKMRVSYDHDLADLVLDYDNATNQAILAAQKKIAGFDSAVAIQRSTDPTKDESIIGGWTSGKIGPVGVVGVAAVKANNGDTTDAMSIGAKATYTIKPLDINTMAYVSKRGKNFGDVTTLYAEASKNIINGLGNLYAKVQNDTKASDGTVTNTVYGRVRLRGDSGSSYDWDLVDTYTRQLDWLKTKTYAGQVYAQNTTTNGQTTLQRLYGIATVKMDVGNGLWVRPEVYIEPVNSIDKNTGKAVTRTLVNGNAYLKLTDRVSLESNVSFENRNTFTKGPRTAYGAAVGFQMDPTDAHIQSDKQVKLAYNSSTVDEVTNNTATLSYMLVF